METTKIMQTYQIDKNLELDKNLARRVNVLEHSLSQLGQGIILLSKQANVLFLTEVAKAAIQKNDGISVHNNKLVALVEQDNTRLQELLELTIRDNPDVPTYKNLYIHRNENIRPYLLLISKMQFDVNVANHNDDGILIIIKDTQANTIHWQERLRSKHKLTKREACFTMLLTEGRNVKEISAIMAISEDTARQYLKSCFKKMEVQKQHELVCMALDCSRKR
jgi:DNA-binding CsgD family transcriptional regulator